jgi:hypothetical protein
MFDVFWFVPHILHVRMASLRSAVYVGVDVLQIFYGLFAVILT